MRIRTIFECGGKHLYTVLFEETDGIKDPEFYSNIEGEKENSTKNEFDKALDRWQDVEYLRLFFIKYRTDLSSFDSAISVSKGRPHLKFELFKLDLVRKFFEDNDKMGLAGFIDIPV